MRFVYIEKKNMLFGLATLCIYDAIKYRIKAVLEFVCKNCKRYIQRIFSYYSCNNIQSLLWSHNTPRIMICINLHINYMYLLSRFSVSHILPISFKNCIKCTANFKKNKKCSQLFLYSILYFQNLKINLIGL